MAERPKFRRGIKLGRIRRAFDIVPLHSRKKHNKGLIIGTRKKYSGKYYDAKTGKTLNETESTQYRSYWAALFQERLQRLPPKSAQRIEKDEQGRYRDRFTKEPLTPKEAVRTKQALLGANRNPLSNPTFPERFIKAARTAARERGTDFRENLQIIYEWWINEQTNIGAPTPFPREQIGSPPLQGSVIL